MKLCVYKKGSVSLNLKQTAGKKKKKGQQEFVSFSLMQFKLEKAVLEWKQLHKYELKVILDYR